ncbi:MAG: Gfo/Idh/MocA family oxidoreductase [Acidobacteriota bacterium]
MDYTKAGWSTKIRKALRYVRLYGPSRTLAKVRAQYHMNRHFTDLPQLKPASGVQQHVGVMGCGNFSFSAVAYYLKKNFGYVIRGTMDRNVERAASLAREYRAAYYTDDPRRIIDDPEIDMVFIASNHATHAEYAIEALKQGKSVHIEKPHVVTEDQLDRLCAAASESTGRVTLGFNRPLGKLGREIKKVLDAQQGPAVMNWFVAGHAIDPDHWYFHPDEGGRVLGNLCHWTDFIYQMVPPENRYPIKITPTRWEKSDCDIAVTYLFGDGTVAAITFSAKGHTFEGVRERFSAHRGDVLISLDDFKTLIIEVVEDKRTIKLPYRDHGHEEAIVRSYAAGLPDGESKGSAVSYLWETGQLFLKTREALEANRPLMVYPYGSDPALSRQVAG